MYVGCIRAASGQRMSQQQARLQCMRLHSSTQVTAAAVDSKPRNNTVPLGSNSTTTATQTCHH